jgi:hypothetical protein
MSMSGRCHQFCGLSPAASRDVDSAGAVPVAVVGGAVVSGVAVEGSDDADGGTIGSTTEVVGGDACGVVTMIDVDGAGCEDGGAVVVVVVQITIGAMGVPPSTSHGAFWARAVPDARLSPITRARAMTASSRVVVMVDRRPSVVRGAGVSAWRPSD